jgi:hypothetical protein
MRSKSSRLQFTGPRDDTIVVGRTGAANVELRFATQGNRIKSLFPTHRLRESNLTEACLTFIGEVKSTLVLPPPDEAAPKKVASKFFILQGGAEPLSSVPVRAEPSQLLLLGNWPVTGEHDP